MSALGTLISDNRTSSMLPHSEILGDNPVSKKLEEKEALKKKNKVGGFFGNLFKGKSKKEEKNEKQVD
jgi:hypothetical protein